MAVRKATTCQVRNNGSGRLNGRETAQKLRVILASPRGFCAGVERAIDIVERALEKFGPPVYVRHEIVHNKRVVETLRAKGAGSSAGQDINAACGQLAILRRRSAKRTRNASAAVSAC